RPRPLEHDRGHRLPGPQLHLALAGPVAAARRRAGAARCDRAGEVAAGAPDDVRVAVRLIDAIRVIGPAAARAVPGLWRRGTVRAPGGVARTSAHPSPASRRRSRWPTTAAGVATPAA